MNTISTIKDGFMLVFNKSKYQGHITTFDTLKSSYVYFNTYQNDVHFDSIQSIPSIVSQSFREKIITLYK